MSLPAVVTDSGSLKRQLIKMQQTMSVSDITIGRGWGWDEVVLLTHAWWRRGPGGEREAGIRGLLKWVWFSPYLGQCVLLYSP